MEDFNDDAADVRYDNLNSLAGRIRARVARTREAEEATATEPVRLATVWGRLNLWREFMTKPRPRCRRPTVSCPSRRTWRDMDRARPRYTQLRLERQAGANGQLVGGVPSDVPHDRRFADRC